MLFASPVIRRFHAVACTLAILAPCTLPMSCATVGAHEINQIYYLGIFDPQEQLPPSFYRIRVEGRSDFFSNVNYAAGWVPAPFIDSLNTKISFDNESGALQFERGDKTHEAKLETGRGLMLFGPEGFRPAPRGHRLAIVMSSDPSEFFQAIEDALGQVSAAKQIEMVSSSHVDQALAAEMLDATREQVTLAEIRRSMEEAR